MFISSNLRGLALLMLVVVPSSGCGGGGATEAGSTAELGGTEAESESETGSDALELGPCEPLFKCTNATVPETLPALEEGYGEDGLCWETMTAQECWALCQMALDGLAELYPNEPYCNGAECTTDAECTDPAEPDCWDDYTCGPLCGNGWLDADEQCDSTEACTAQCTFEFHECSPLTNVPCAAGEKCLTVEDPNMPGSYYYTCYPDAVGSAGPGDTCMSQLDCSLAAPVCLEGALGCDGLCCTKYCYMGQTDEDFASCPPGSSCEPFPLSGLQPGIWPDIGICY